MKTLEAIDLGALYWFGSLHRPWLDPVVKAVTYLGGWVVLLPFSLACVLLLLRLGQRRLAVALAALALASVAVQVGVKAVVKRPRPDVAWRLVALSDQPSFPSGHATCAMAIYVGAALVFGRLMRQRRQVVLACLAVVLSMVVGLTRPYLGVHYPVDVFAGWIAGLGCAFIGYALVVPERKEEGVRQAVSPATPRSPVVTETITAHPHA